MLDTNYYYVTYPRLQDWLWGQGLKPYKINGDVYYYEFSKELKELLDLYYIETSIF